MTDWNSFNTWHLVLPPSRPSYEQLKRIQMVISDVSRDLPVAILGSTPEFRDLLRHLGFNKIYIFEMNLIFYEKMKDLMVYDTSREIVIQGDWLTSLPQYKDFFSVILSDLTMGNLPYESRKSFYKYLNEALQKDGIFIDKILTHDYFYNVEQLIYDYSSQPLNLYTANLFNCKMLFCSELIAKTEIINTTEIYDFLKNKVGEGWMDNLLELTELITPKGGIWYYGRRRIQVEQDYLSQLSLKMVWDEPEYSPYYLYARHYFFKKKN